MPRPVLGKLRPQPQHCSGYNFTTVSTRSTGTNGRFRPSCPSCPPGLRLLLFFLPRCRGEPANPSDDGGLDDVVEFCNRIASCRSRSAIFFSASTICFSASANCRSRSANCSRNLSNSRSSRSFRRRSSSAWCWFVPAEFLYLCCRRRLADRALIQLNVAGVTRFVQHSPLHSRLRTQNG
jgi:hypothetical protein